MDEQKALKEFQERIGYKFKDRKAPLRAHFPIHHLQMKTRRQETAMKGLNFLEIQCFL